MERQKIFNIVVVVCHPDDEAIWFGGLLHEFSLFPFIRMHVLCLSGRDPSSPRSNEFEAARRVSGYVNGKVLGKPLRPANIPLPSTRKTVQAGLAELKLCSSDVSVLITHSPFGDELRSNHHMQAFRELRSWTARNRIAFGFFSCVAIPWYAHTPYLMSLRRRDTLHLLNGFICRHARTPWPWRWIDPAMRPFRRSPKYYLQFQSDRDNKEKMLNSYQSIDLEAHRKSYSAFTSACEGLYLYDDKAYEPIAAIIKAMPVPGHAALFEQRSVLSRILARARRRSYPQKGF